VQRPFLRLLASILALALVAVGCRVDSTTTADFVAQAEPSIDDGSDPDDRSAPDEPAAEPTADATAEPTPEPAPSFGEPGSPFTGQAPAAFEPPAEWSDPVPLASEVAQGTLGNGMDYLVRSNNRPGGQAQMWLVVEAGSLNEAPGTEGSAHFLEHMLFNGTERFPGNELIPVLENFGAVFGPDINAYTSFGETVYQLEVPARSDDSLQLALDVLHQWATAATIAPDAVIAERGVVRDEFRRSIETVDGRIGQEIRSVLFEGTDYLGNEPIGLASVIEAMTDVELRAYYETWYRPELMTVVVVGDIDVSDIVERIENTFVQPASQTPTEPFEVAPIGGLEAPVFDVIVDTELQRPDLQVFWRTSGGPTTSAALTRESIVRDVALAMVDRRLLARVQSADTVLSRAAVGVDGPLGDATLLSAFVQAPAADQEAALAELLLELEQARQFGFGDDELAVELDAYRSSIELAFAQRDTRQDRELASELVEYVLGRSGAPSEEERRQILLEVLDTITVDDAQRVLFELLDAEPYVVVTGPTADEASLATPEALAAVYDAIVGVALEEQVQERTTLVELMEAPEPAPIVDRTTSGNVTTVTYDNGARLVFRTSTIQDDVVLLRATSPGGFFAIDGPEVPLLGRTPGLVGGSGFESIDIVTLARFLSTRVVSLSTDISRAEESIAGEAATDELEVLLQLIHLQLTEPTITDVRVRQFDEQWRPLATDPTSDPGLTARLALWQARYGMSPWFRLIPTLEDLDRLDQDALLAAYKDRFADAGDFVFAVTGDFDAEELVDLGARYLGTLPDSGRREVPIDRDPGIPPENVVETVAVGVGDQGRLRINWESPYPFTLEADVTAQAVELVVNARLRDLVREELGASYSPNAAVSVLVEPKPWVDTIIDIGSDPDRVDEVAAVVRDELARIRAGDFDPQYLALATEQLSESYRFFTNNEILRDLLFFTQYPDRPSNEVFDRTDIVQSLTVDDIAQAATVIFPPNQSVEIRQIPAEDG
jgi:zinc protease